MYIYTDKIYLYMKYIVIYINKYKYLFNLISEIYFFIFIVIVK